MPSADPVITLFSALFCEPGAIDQAASLIRPEDFPQDDHRRAYSAMLELMQTGKPIDTAHVSAKLQERGMTAIQADELIERLMDGAPIRAQIRNYCGLVRQSSRKRRLMAMAEAALTRARDNVNTAQIIEALQSELWALQSDRPESGPVAARDVVPGFLDHLTARRNRSTELAGLSTGIPELDDFTTGLRPGETWIAGALPGRGKTAFGTQVAVDAANHGVPVLFFSLEMTTEELLCRILGNRFGVWQMRTLNVSDKTFVEICEHAAGLGTLPLYVDDSSALSATELSARARTAVRERGIKLIVVDYLQLLQGPEREIRERVGNAANTLRQLAKDTGVPVLALSQLRRPPNLNDRPNMTHLKESGDIECHAHTVLLLYSPLKVDTARPTGEDEIIIGKQRNGPLGTLPVVFDTRTLVFKPRIVAALVDG
jgi:replicative DNA helicase